MRKTGRREDRQLLAPNQRIQSVDGGDACLDELRRVLSGRRIHRQSVDVHPFFRKNLRPAVDGAPHAVENTAQHIRGDAEFHRAAQKTDLAVAEVDAGRGFKELHQRIGAVDLQHLAPSRLSACQLDLAQLVVLDVFDAFHQHQRTGNFPDRTVFLCHAYSSSFAVMSANSFVSSSCTF